MIINGGKSVDDRGKVTFINDFNFKDVERFYVVENHSKGFVRAWHGHKKEGKYVFVVTGAIKLAVKSMNEEDTEIPLWVLSADSPQIMYIPPGNYNGFMTLTDDTKVIFFSTSTLEESKGDDYREPARKWDVWYVEER